MALQYWPKRAVLIGYFSLVFAGASPAAAGTIEDPAAIRAAIEEAMAPRLAAIRAADTDIVVDAIDARLQFPQCPGLTVTLPPSDAAMISAKVTCPAPAWTVYVPVHLHAWVEAVVAAGNLVPNRALGAADLGRGRVDLFAARGGIITDPRQAEGKILRAGLAMGSPVLMALLDLPVSVHRGQKVVLTLSDQSMVIRATAVALEDGRVGDNIAVQNPDSQKTLRATVDGDGGVTLKF